MEKYLRQLGFLVYAFLLRWPIWLLIWVLGRSGIFKTLFLIYPTDSSECLDFCPNIRWLRNFFSGRPTPAGLIMDGWCPLGIYLVIPDPALELMRKKNRPMVETIIKRMLWVQRISGAQTIGLAGQLGPIFEKRHGFTMAPPFYTSTYGNIFSIQKAVSHLVHTSKKNPWQVSVAIIGGGLLGEDLMQHLGADGYQMSMVDIRYTRKGDVKLMNEEKTHQQLAAVDLVVNLLPRGKDFMDCQLHHLIPAEASIIDFSRPPIVPEDIPQNVVMGNRVQRSGMHFFMRLPGGWKRHELPACSMPSVVASLCKRPLLNIEEFRLVANQYQFRTALAGAPVQRHNDLSNTLGGLASVRPIAARFMLFVFKGRQAVSR
jgi:hypothetical protein